MLLQWITNPPGWATELVPILGLLAAILVVVRRLPKVDLGHSPAFVRRRAMNWLPLGLTYGFLYMGRYNLSVYQKVAGALLTKAQFGTIFAVGTITYGVSFLLNGPLTDRWGGRATILLSAVGSAAANVAIGLVLYTGWTDALVLKLSVLYAINMYFQSFGAVSIVKVNAYWFHLRERGLIGGVFGILISLGLYFAYDWGGFIVKHYPHYMAFFVPAAILLLFAAIDWFLVQNAPSVAGFDDFDVGDASAGDDGPRMTVFDVAGSMLRNRAIVIIALVEFMSGYLRNAILVWYPRFANEVGQGDSFVAKHWGMMSCIAGILGGMFAGVISDRVFDSRRGPVSAVLYGGMVGGAVCLVPLLASPLFGWVMVFMSLCIIGVHGMLSGTASMDFGGKKNAGIAVGIIDGFVYLGVATEALVLGKVLPEGPAKADAHNWWTWPVAMLPAALVGLALASQLWNARAQRTGH
jgi:OPA family glycerol-3-phosphate transporter-like MFS transporter